MPFFNQPPRTLLTEAQRQAIINTYRKVLDTYDVNKKDKKVQLRCLFQAIQQNGTGLILHNEEEVYRLVAMLAKEYGIFKDTDGMQLHKEAFMSYMSKEFTQYRNTHNTLSDTTKNRLQMLLAAVLGVPLAIVAGPVGAIVARDYVFPWYFGQPKDFWWAKGGAALIKEWVGDQTYQALEGGGLKEPGVKDIPAVMLSYFARIAGEYYYDFKQGHETTTFWGKVKRGLKTEHGGGTIYAYVTGNKGNLVAGIPFMFGVVRYMLSHLRKAYRWFVPREYDMAQLFQQADTSRWDHELKGFLKSKDTIEIFDAQMLQKERSMTSKGNGSLEDGVEVQPLKSVASQVSATYKAVYKIALERNNQLPLTSRQKLDLLLQAMSWHSKALEAHLHHEKNCYQLIQELGIKHGILYDTKLEKSAKTLALNVMAVQLDLYTKKHHAQYAQLKSLAYCIGVVGLTMAFSLFAGPVLGSMAHWLIGLVPASNIVTGYLRTALQVIGFGMGYSGAYGGNMSSVIKGFQTNPVWSLLAAPVSAFAGWGTKEISGAFTSFSKFKTWLISSHIQGGLFAFMGSTGASLMYCWNTFVPMAQYTMNSLLKGLDWIAPTNYKTELLFNEKEKRATWCDSLAVYLKDDEIVATQKDLELPKGQTFKPAYRKQKQDQDQNKPQYNYYQPTAPRNTAITA